MSSASCQSNLTHDSHQLVELQSCYGPLQIEALSGMVIRGQITVLYGHVKHSIAWSRDGKDGHIEVLLRSYGRHEV